VIFTHIFSHIFNWWSDLKKTAEEWHIFEVITPSWRIDFPEIDYSKVAKVDVSGCGFGAFFDAFDITRESNSPTRTF